jgi:hypothetical protein
VTPKIRIELLIMRIPDLAVDLAPGVLLVLGGLLTIAVAIRP